MNTAVPSGTASTYFVFKPKSNGKTGDISFRYDDKLPVVPKVHCASWTKKDNDALLSVVGSISANKIDWQTVSNLLRENFKFNASPMECLMQYRNSVSPTIKKCDWSKEEVDKLTELAAYYNEHEWCAIAEELGTNRTPMQCLQYYQRNLNHRLIRSNNIWTEEEEKQLKQSIEVYGSSDWSNVASDLPGRTPTQCFNRYRRSSLCQGDVITGHWLEEEEKLLYFACVAMHAPQSSSFKKSPEQLSLLLNDNIVSGSNNSSSDNGRKSKKRPISILQENGTEPDGLIEMVAGTDSSETKSAGKFKGWTAIAQLIPGKNDVQCREKWNNNLDPTLNTGKYSVEEDTLLLQLVEKLGEGHWTLVASYMQGRSDASVRSRYTQLIEVNGRPRKGKKSLHLKDSLA